LNKGTEALCPLAQPVDQEPFNLAARKVSNVLPVCSAARYLSSAQLI
jgi:hypothetical protein